VGNVSWPGKRSAIGAFVRVTAEIGIILNVHLVGVGRKRGVLVYRQSIVAAAGFGAIAVAWEVALALVQSRRIDGCTTVTLAIIFEARVAKAVALALGDTRFNGHISGTLPRAVLEGPGRSVLKASRINKRPERLKTRRKLEVGGMSVLEKREGCSSPENLCCGHDRLARSAGT
jgi:hypothetical protein